MGYPVEHREYGDPVTLEILFVLARLRQSLPYNTFVNVLLHGTALFLASQPEHRNELLALISKQAKIYEPIFR